jgi:aspartyl-tRNA(Asn)/glutamyl-tRNA(Gln) amidotransferase subunit B
MPVEIDEKWIKAVRVALPESAEDKLMRLTGDLGLSEYESKRIAGSKTLSDIFDSTMKFFNKPKEISNWILEELLSIAKGDNKGEDDIKINTEMFAKLIDLVDNKTINRNTGKVILLKVLNESIDPAVYVQENQLSMISDTSTLEKAVNEALAENTKSVDEYKNGNEKVLGFLVGQTMKKLCGKADPKTINEMIRENIDN